MFRENVRFRVAPGIEPGIVLSRVCLPGYTTYSMGRVHYHGGLLGWNVQELIDVSLDRGCGVVLISRMEWVQAC